MSFMKCEIIQKGSAYAGDCAKCGRTHIIQEWITDDFNGERDGMKNGTLHCPDHCGGRIDSDTFTKLKRQYAGRYSAPGYMDCTDWSFDTHKRRLERELRSMYGDDE